MRCAPSTGKILRGNIGRRGKKGNIQRVEVAKESTVFWAMRARATDKAALAHATVARPLAENLVQLLLLGGKDFKKTLFTGTILETQGGKERVRLTNLDLLFQCHCVGS